VTRPDPGEDCPDRPAPSAVVVQAKDKQAHAGLARYRICAGPSRDDCTWHTITGGHGASKRHRWERCTIGEPWPACTEPDSR
jgi:hypothetical protein